VIVGSPVNTVSVDDCGGVVVGDEAEDDDGEAEKVRGCMTRLKALVTDKNKTARARRICVGLRIARDLFSEKRKKRELRRLGGADRYDSKALLSWLMRVRYNFLDWRAC
jgi:hypothetical protein